MPTPLSFLEKLAPRARGQDIGPDPSALTGYELVMRPDGISQPVTLIQMIAKLGPGLSMAHEAVNRLVNGGTVRLKLDDSDPKIIVKLESLGVAIVRR